jgi:hypothetical protein
LRVQTVQGVVKDALQNGREQEHELLEAFVYYYDNDAFMT